MLQVASRKFKSFRSLVEAQGLTNCLMCQAATVALLALRKVLPFDRWHATNHTVCRPYKRFIAGLVNDLGPRTVVEVGSGIGDIMALIDASSRWTIDPDAAALKAARIVHPLKGSRSIVGDLASLSLVPGKIDVLLAIGWLHLYDADELERLIKPHLDRIGYVIVDRFTEWKAPFTHDFAFLGGELVKRVAPPEDDIREYLVYKVC